MLVIDIAVANLKRGTGRFEMVREVTREGIAGVMLRMLNRVI
jgi:hypothetical protein